MGMRGRHDHEPFPALVRGQDLLAEINEVLDVHQILPAG